MHAFLLQGTEKFAIQSGFGKLRAIKQKFPNLEEVRFYKLAKKSEIKELLLKYDERSVQLNYKFGILYGKSGQNTENDMFNNGTSFAFFSVSTPLILRSEHGGDAFNEFLDFLGERVTLQGYSGYNGGLDVKRMCLDGSRSRSC